MCCRKFVVEFDQHLATNNLGNDARPLTKENITNFLDDFGLEPEFALHSHIRGLSGALGGWVGGWVGGWAGNALACSLCPLRLCQ